MAVCLLPHTPGEYVKERRGWTFGDLLHEDKIVPDTYAVFLHGSTVLYRVDLCGAGRLDMRI